MSDFDDYFDDDVVFDEQTLAALDREEQKFYKEDHSQPPVKRQKTTESTKSVPTNKRWPSINDLDSLPDISLEFDGNYTAETTLGQTLTRPHHGNGHKSLHQNAGPSSASAHSIRIPVPSFDFSMRTGTGPLAASTPKFPQMPRPNGNVSRVQRQPPANLHQPTQPSMLVDTASVNIAEELQKQLDKLKSKFEELSQENTKIQAALKDSIAAKQAKEGEVTILRKGIERTTKTHAEQIASLKAEREEAVSSRIRLQKDMREEIERMRTELSFKQSEQDSIRAALHSSRSKKISDTSRVPQSTQAPSGYSNTQSGSRIPPQKQTKSAFLPGFQNAFSSEPSQYERPSSPSKKLKLRRHPSQMETDPPFSPLDETPAPDIIDDVPMTDGMAEEFNQLDLEDAELQSPALEEYPTEPVNPMSELIRVLFTHTTPESSHPTIHLLLQESIPDGADDSGVTTYKEYAAACDQMLCAIATSSRAEDFAFAVQSISDTFVIILPILRRWNSWSCMAVALDLLVNLLYTLPNFGPILFSSNESHPGHPILNVLLRVVGEKHDHVPDSVIIQLVAVLEAFCFNADDRVVEKLAVVPSRWHNLVNLLNQGSSLQTWLSICRFLAVLASHRDLCRGILSMPEPPADSSEKVLVPVKIPLVERLCLILVENTRHSPESSELKKSILTFFALLSTSQPDVHNHLLLSSSVIPAVILFLSQLTTPFWEDDEELVLADSADVISRIRTINQTLFFLHYLIFSSASLLNLRQKLYVASHRVFYGLIHPFVVTFGRLTYGEAPDWVGERGKTELMALTDIARDILEHVLDGPEADKTWQTYANDLREEDEDEMEAELLGHRAD